MDHSQRMAAMLSDLAAEHPRNKDDNIEENHEFWIGTDDKNMDSPPGSSSQKGGTPYIALSMSTKNGDLDHVDTLLRTQTFTSKGTHPLHCCIPRKHSISHGHII